MTSSVPSLASRIADTPELRAWWNVHFWLHDVRVNRHCPWCASDGLSAPLGGTDTTEGPAVAPAVTETAQEGKC